MTDKEKIIKELKEVLDSLDITNKYRLNLIRAIEYLQEEPVSELWHDASEPPIIDKTFLLIAPNGNSSLCLWGGKELHSVTIGGGHSVLCKGDIYLYIDDLLNLDNSCNFGKNLQKEPVSEDLEEAAKNHAHSCHTSKATGERIAACIYDFKAGAKWKENHLWKPADGNKLPKIDREVIALLDNGTVVFAHRPPEFWDGKNIGTGKVTRYYPKTYDKGGWNIPDVKWWLDCSLSNIEED